MAPPVSSARAPARTDSGNGVEAGTPAPAPKVLRFARPVLCAVLDVAALGHAPGIFARDLFKAGVDWIQLRDRAVSAETLARAAAELVAARDTTSRVLINKRVDVAIVTGADGVHLGGDALAPAHAAEVMPKTALLGASFHTEEEILGAFDTGLAYGHLAPIWDPRSKPAERPALGTRRLGAAAAIGLPLIAQGGLDAERGAEAISVGAAGIAVTGLLTQAVDPIGAARALREALDRADVQAG